MRAIRKYEQGGKHNSPLLSLLQRQRDRVNAKKAARESEAITPIFSFDQDINWNTSPGPMSHADPGKNVMFYKRGNNPGAPYSFKVKTSSKGYTDFSSLDALESALNDPGMFKEEGLREQAIGQMRESFPMTQDNENRTISFDLSLAEKRELNRSPKELNKMTSQDVFKSFMFELTPDEASRFRGTKYSIRNIGGQSKDPEGGFGEGRKTPKACLNCAW